RAKRFRGRGTMDVADASRRDPVPVARGVAELEGRWLRVGTWQLDLGELVAHTLDWGEILVLRTKRQRLTIRMPDDSRALWTLALDEAMAEARGAPTDRAGVG